MQFNRLAGGVLRQDSRDAAIRILQERQRLHTVDHLDMGGGGHGVGKRFHDRLAGKIARDARNAGAGVSGFEREGEFTVCRAARMVRRVRAGPGRGSAPSSAIN